MLTVILLFSSLITYAIMLGTYLSQAKYKDGMIFAVTLPKEAAKHRDIERIRAVFKKQMTNISIVFAVLLIPLFFLSETFQALYFLIWMFVIVIGIVFPFRRAHRDTLALKRKNDWFVGARKVVQTDLRAMMRKNERAAPYWLYAIPLASAIGLTIYWMRDGMMLLGVTAIFTVLLLAFAGAAFRNARTKVYSSNSQLNVSLNQASRRIWSYTFFSLALVEVFHFYLIGCSILNENAVFNDLWIAIPMVFTIVPLVLILNANYKIKRIVNDAVASDGTIIYSDEDEYWGNGFTYHNPHDRRVFVEKRIGVGMTVNTGTTAGKWFIGVTIGIAAAIVIGVSFLTIYSELSPPVLTITEEQRVEIDYMMYSVDFPAEAMIDIALVNEIPQGWKTNGEATDTVARGHFRLNDLGKSRLFVYKNNPPYIRIQLEDEYIFYNEKDAGETERVYERLQQLLKR